MPSWPDTTITTSGSSATTPTTSFPYLVNGAGGHPTLYGFSTPVGGSQVRYSSDWGAQRVTTSATQLTFEFINRAGIVIDTYAISKPPAVNTATIGLHRPTDGQFFLRNSNTAGPADVAFGFGAANAGWLPIAGDWNGPGANSGVALAGPDAPGPGDSSSNETDHGDHTLRTAAARDEPTPKSVWPALIGVSSRSWEGVPTIDSIAAGPRVPARRALLDFVFAEPLDLL